jgi:tetratricopeptide (TPR) repeat protein
MSAMSGNKTNGKINALIQRGEWDEARRLLIREQDKDPTNHWVLTQLGVTFYEQRRYEEALELFLSSRKIVPDCPLTLWNLAGTFDALGKHAKAIRIYTSLLQSNKSPADDPCWESPEWSDALKTDCVYRLGVCFQKLGKKPKAEVCYHQFLNLLSIGIEATYSIDDVKRQMRGLQGMGKTNGIASEVRKAFSATLQASGIEPS